MKYVKGLRNELIGSVKMQISHNNPSFVKDCYERLTEYLNEEDALQMIAAALAYEMSLAMFHDEEVDERHYARLLKRVADGNDLYDDADFDEEEWDEFNEDETEYLWQNLLQENSRGEIEEIAGYFDIEPELMGVRETAEAIAEAMLDPNAMTAAFLHMHDGLTEKMDRLMKKGSIPADKDMVDEMILADIPKDYFIFRGSEIAVPKDVQKAYQKMNTPEVRQMRRHVSWLKDVAMSFVTLYGSAPVSIFTELYNLHPELRMTEEETLDFILSGKKKDRVLDLVGDRLVYAPLLKKKEYRRLEKQQGERPFDIPSWQEVEAFGRMQYPALDPAYTDMKQWLHDNAAYHIEMADLEILSRLYEVFNAGGTLKEAAMVIEEYDPNFDRTTWFDCLLHLSAMALSTRCILYRGAPLNHYADALEINDVLEGLETGEGRLFPDEDDLPF